MHDIRKHYLSFIAHTGSWARVKSSPRLRLSLLRFFGEKVAAARKVYRAYVEKGIAQGRRPELVAGGLIGSAGGWSVVKAMRRAQDHMKSDGTKNRDIVHNVHID